MSPKSIYGGITYVSTSVYLPREYGMQLESAIAVGATGDFANYLSTTNANLAGYMIQAQVTIE